MARPSPHFKLDASTLRTAQRMSWSPRITLFFGRKNLSSKLVSTVTANHANCFRHGRYNTLMRRNDATGNELVIDRGAAAEKPSPEAITEWAADKRVFVSSVMAELREERQAAAEAIKEIGATPVLFERFGGRDANPEQAYLSELETCQVYIGILGRRYGTVLPSRYSATHTEYLHAEKEGIRMALWALEADDREGHEQSFLTEARSFYVVPTFSRTSDLREQIVDRLKTIAAEDLAPWVKLGGVVFRAAQVTDRGDKIEVFGRLRSDEVIHAFEQFRPTAWSRSGEMRFTWQGMSRTVYVTQMETTVTASRSRTVQISLEVKERTNSNFELTFGDLGPDDLTEMGLRSVLFGEPFPKPRYETYSRVNDPWVEIRKRPVAEEVVRPIASLLLTDELVGSGRAARITAIKLGVPIRGNRLCRVEWIPPQRYSGEAPTRKMISGNVVL